MSKQRQDEYKCPLEVTMEIIGGKYKGVIIGHLIDKTLRYNELQKLISHATPKMLIQQLKELEADSITRHLKLKCLTLKIKNFKFASNLRENF